MATSLTKAVHLYYDVISPHAWITFEQLLKYKSVWNIDIALKPFSLISVLVTANKGKQEDIFMKLHHLNKDIELIGKYYGIPIKTPTNAYEKIVKRGTSTAMRLLTATEQTKPDLTEKLSRSLWLRLWSLDKDITERASLIQAGKDVGVPESEMEYLLQKSKEKCTTTKLRAVIDEAVLKGVFSAPTMIVEDKENKTHIISGLDEMHVLAMILDKPYQTPVTSRDFSVKSSSSKSQSQLYEPVPSAIQGTKITKPA